MLTFLPEMTRRMIATNAINSNVWIKEPALYAKNPIAQPMMSITAMIYNKFPMLIVLKWMKIKSC